MMKDFTRRVRTISDPFLGLSRGAACWLAVLLWWAPTLVWAQPATTSFVGGEGQDELRAAVIDDSGAIVIGGTSDSDTILGVSGTTLEAGTGFVAKLSADASTVLWLRRLGAVHDLQLGRDGTLIVQQTSRVVALAEDGDGFAWEGPVGSEIVSMAVGADGKVAVLGGGIALYDVDGSSAIWSKSVGRSEPAAVAIDPLTGDVFVSGDTNTNTGFEPWRSPFLFRYRASDGERLSELYDWPGPAVREDGRQYQADSFITHLAFAPSGELWVGAGSDGGNSVLRREPDDLDTAQDALVGACFDSPCFGYKGAKKTGMFARLTPELDDFSRASWVVPYLKMPPATTQNPPCGCKAGSFQGGTEVQPGSFSVTELFPTDEGVIVLGEPWGEAPVTDDAWFPQAVYGGGGIGWVGRFDADLSSISSASMLPGTKSAVGDYRGGRLVVVGRAEAGGAPASPAEESWDRDFITTEGSLQPQFGGGASDGYLLVACLTDEQECSAPPPPLTEAGGALPGGAGDAGGADGGPSDPGDDRADGATASDSGGCGCRSARGGTTPGWWWAALLVALLGWGRRRLGRASSLD